MKSAAGQYECVHKSGIGLDYFTSRVDRLTLQPNGRFVLIVQERNRISQAAQSLASGQQISAAAPEVRREGTYLVQATSVSLNFDDGTQQQGQLATTSDGSGNTLQLGQDVFTKTSDSTLLPSADRLKKDMEDIAKGLKIAGAIGSAAIKAVKTIHDTLQTNAEPQDSQVGQSTSAPPTSSAASASPISQVSPASPTSTQPAQSPPQHSQQVVYCDQCGAPSRPGKRFCNRCGAPLV